MNGHEVSVEPSVAGHRPAQPNLVAVSDAVARQESPNPWATFALVAVGTFMTMLDAVSTTLAKQTQNQNAIYETSR